MDDFNRAEVKFPSTKTIHEQFEDQVRINNDKTAVIAGDRSLSYAQLNDASNQLARYLKLKYDIKPDDVIGLLVGRSEQMICGILSVLKSGGAFLSVDPSYPISRIKHILYDARVKVLMCESKYIDRISDYSGPLFLIDEASDLPFMAKNNLPVANTSGNLAYVMYTSGSTGNPKGVPIEHRGLFNTQFWRKKFYRFDETYVTLQIASFSFDSSINDIFSMLLWGGTLLIADENERLDIKSLSELIVSKSITNFNVVSSFYSVLLDEMDPKTNCLKVITLAGEKLTKEIIRRHFEKFPDVPIVNEYGPTENSICSTATIIKEIGPGDTHIGRPIDNTKVYILGEEREILPPGVTGEICISGVGLARGYLNNPELSEEKFVLNPFIPGRKMYRTGDLGRWNVDGNIEFLGRMDDQVKIRGCRVELEEIEVALAQHPAVRENIVIIREDESDDKRLTAYCILDHVDTPPVSELRRILGEKLPEYMIPSDFIFLDNFPLTDNGKIDRQALPISDFKRPDLEVDFVAPRTPIEEELAGIWTKALGVEKVGVHDSFFELGGHSLLATQVLSLMNSFFQVNLKLHCMFDTPVIAQLAEAIEDILLQEIETLTEEDAEKLLMKEQNEAS